MWKNILCQLGLSNCQPELDHVDEVLFHKIKVLLHKANSETHFRICRVMIKKYESSMREKGCPYPMIDSYNELVKLWVTTFTLWKRG